MDHQTWCHDAFMQKTASLVIEWLGRNAASLDSEHKPSLSFCVLFVFGRFSHRLFFYWLFPSLSVIYLFLSLLDLSFLTHCQLSLSDVRFMFREFDGELWAQMSLKGISVVCFLQCVVGMLQQHRFLSCFICLPLCAVRHHSCVPLRPPPTVFRHGWGWSRGHAWTKLI